VIIFKDRHVGTQGTLRGRRAKACLNPRLVETGHRERFVEAPSEGARMRSSCAGVALSPASTAGGIAGRQPATTGRRTSATTPITGMAASTRAKQIIRASERLKPQQKTDVIDMTWNAFASPGTSNIFRRILAYFPAIRNDCKRQFARCFASLMPSHKHGCQSRDSRRVVSRRPTSRRSATDACTAIRSPSAQVLNLRLPPWRDRPRFDFGRDIKTGVPRRAGHHVLRG